MPETQHSDDFTLNDSGLNSALNSASDTHQRLDRGGVLGAAAEASIEKGNFEEAENLYLQALTAREEIYGEVHRKLVPLLNSLALLYTTVERFPESEAVFNRALDILQSCPKESKVREIEVLTNFGLMLRKAGRNIEAEHVEACLEAVRREEDQAPLLLKLARGLTPSTSIDVRDFGKWLDQTTSSSASGVEVPISSAIKALQKPAISQKKDGFNWRFALIGVLAAAWAIWFIFCVIF